MQIETATYPSEEKPTFSILVPTWNNLAYLQCCVESIRRHSAFSHQIIVHVNDGSDGTLEWVRAQRLDHSWSAENVGVCHALNAAAQLARTDYIAFLNDDMYALPDWDKVLLDEIKRIPHQRWFLSGTMIEPTDTGNACVIAPEDYGRTTEEFRETELLAGFRDFSMPNWSGATWPPNVVPRALWDAVGGYSVEFSPGMYSDPDFSMKLWQAGVRYFKGLGGSRVYHFQTKSTGKVTKNPGKQQFLKKWGIGASTFAKYYLRRGKTWTGELSGPGLHPAYLAARFKDFWKRLLA